ncbi:MAG: sensor histidine kinase [Burkholderiaceae bacterium]
MSPDDPPGRLPVELVIPDCCNTGVIFRALVAVNAAALAASFTRTAGPSAALLDFALASPPVELGCMLSLFCLCGLRRLVRSIPAWGQRALCAAVPAAVAAAILHGLSLLPWTAAGGAYPGPVDGMLVAALAGAALQHYFELRARAFSPALVEARLQALQARIRPHFLFNSLNAVLSLVRSEPRRAEAALEDLADMFRALMRDSRHVTTLEQELRFCRQYLAIEKIRLGERLQVRWSTDGIGGAALRRIRVPALILQPLLENAVHYGVEPSAAPALIEVRLSRTIDRLHVAVVNPVTDEAAGAASVAPARHGNRMALQNIRERLALLYDVEAQLTTHVAPGSFEVRLQLPYEKTLFEDREAA